MWFSSSSRISSMKRKGCCWGTLFRIISRIAWSAPIHASVDVNDASRHISAFCGKEGNNLGNFMGRAYATQRDAGENSLFHFLRQTLRHLRIDKAGGDGI